MIRFGGLVVITALLVGCAGGGPSPQLKKRIDRALAIAPGAAQPSKIVAAEIAFARAARERGQWTAFAEFAGNGALIHGRNGPIVAAPWLATQKNPDEAVQWRPRAVWMSCNGDLAVSNGRFEDPEGNIGSFVTVWKRQNDDSYLWVYDSAGLDENQPSGASTSSVPVENEITVSAFDAIQGRVADCPKRDAPTPTAPSAVIAVNNTSGTSSSIDGTLKWRWEHSPTGSRTFVAEYFHEGEWQIALDQRFDPASEAIPSED